MAEAFAEGARRAREAGLDGVEMHGANGYIFTQFLSARRSTTATTNTAARSRTAPASCSRPFGRSAQRVGDDFHLQVKLSTTEYANALLPWAKKGNTIEDSVQVARWLEEAGADAIHVSTGNTFPHPDEPRRRLRRSRTSSRPTT